MSNCDCEIEITDQSQKLVLFWLLGINAAMFLLEICVGWIADSTALIADSIDMLADAVVYGIALYAVSKKSIDKVKAAQMSGYFQITLGLIVFTDILRRIMMGSEPVSILIISMGILALLANTFCLFLIHKHKDGDIHMRASWIFSANDVIANVGVILGGGLVLLLDNRWPDIIIGIIIIFVILRGARLILKDANLELKKIKAL